MIVSLRLFRTGCCKGCFQKKLAEWRLGLQVGGGANASCMRLYKPLKLPMSWDALQGDTNALPSGTATDTCRNVLCMRVVAESYC